MKENCTKKLEIDEEDINDMAEQLMRELTKDSSKDVLQLHSEKLFTSNLKERTIWIDLEISIERNSIAPTILDIEKQILEWNREDKGKPVEERKPIKLLIYCFGGDLEATLSLISIMNISKTPIYTYNMGVAYSGAFMTLVNGHKRFALKNSTGLFHEGSAHIQGNAEDVRSAQSNYERQLKVVKENIVERTKIDLKTLQKYKDKQWYIPSAQLLELGVVDEIITDIDEII